MYNTATLRALINGEWVTRGTVQGSDEETVKVVIGEWLIDHHLGSSKVTTNANDWKHGIITKWESDSAVVTCNFIAK